MIDPTTIVTYIVAAITTICSLYKIWKAGKADEFLFNVINKIFKSKMERLAKQAWTASISLKFKSFLDLADEDKIRKLEKVLDSA